MRYGANMIAKPLATSIRILDRSLSGRVDELRGKLLIKTGLNVSKGSVFEAALKFLLEQARRRRARRRLRNRSLGSSHVTEDDALIRKWDNAIATHAAMSGMSNVAGGRDMQLAQRLAEVDEMLEVSRGAITYAMTYLPEGEREDALRLAHKNVKYWTIQRDELEKLRTFATASPETMAKDPAIVDLVRKSHNAQAALEDGVRRGVAFAENRRLLRESTKADMLLGEAMAKFR